jgi:hypothetical protein
MYYYYSSRSLSSDEKKRRRSVDQARGGSFQRNYPAGTTITEDEENWDR